MIPLEQKYSLSQAEILAVEDKLLSSYDVDELSGCWEWSGPKDRDGYGLIKIKRSSLGAHRVSYWLSYNQDITEQYVCLQCDNPGCINPKHLFLGSQLENMRDMYDKGRANHAWGESHGMYDNTIYGFYNKDGLEFKGTRSDFIKFSGLDSSSVSKLILAKIGQTHGWKIDRA